MAYSIRESIALVSRQGVRSSIAIDAPKVANNVNSYIEGNELTYYLCINCWLLLVKEYSQYGWIEMRSRILEKGLISTIRLFDEFAQTLVVDGDLDLNPDFALPKAIMRDIQTRYAMIDHFDTDRSVGRELYATALQILRFPKRFSPVYADKVEDETIRAFISNQNRVKLLQRYAHPQWMIAAVKDIISKSLPWDIIISKIKQIMLCDIEFPTGAGADAKANLLSKLHAIAKMIPQYFYRPYDCVWYYQAAFEHRVAVVRCVPKSYKSGRIIAMEYTYRQAIAKRIFSIIDKYLPSAIDLHDQSKNNVLAREGSIYGNYATIDLSHASDDVSMTLFREIFPEEFIEYAVLLCPEFYQIDKTTRRLHSIATMGNALTFVIESLTFYGIALAAVEFFNRFAQRSEDKVSIYGDDIIVPNDAAPTVIEWLQRLGFVPNLAKTFSTGSFRESCGRDYYKGIDVSSYYYPRFPITGKLSTRISLKQYVVHDGYIDEYTDTTQRVIALQHRLFSVCYPASVLLTQAVLESHVKMTSSYAGTESSDLWAYDERYVTRQLPKASVETTEIRVKGLLLPVKVVKVWKLAASDYTVTGHYCPITRGKRTSEQSDEYYDFYRYIQFLKTGPRYSDGLSRLLGISEPDLPVSRAAGNTEIVWKPKF
jgi:hypothetical protein